MGDSENFKKVFEEYRKNINNKPFNHNNLSKKELKILNQRYDEVIEYESLDYLIEPKYNYDFTNKKDKKKFYRGGYEYKRPLGWKRYAIDTSNLNESVYEDDDDWIKKNDWCVAYHGTAIKNVESIVNNGFDVTKSHRNKYGIGIYCSPNIEIAESYSKTFESQITGGKYKIVLQVRVNPDSIKSIPKTDYWLIEDDLDIRPYGILIKEY